MEMAEPEPSMVPSLAGQQTSSEKGPPTLANVSHALLIESEKCQSRDGREGEYKHKHVEYPILGELPAVQ